MIQKYALICLAFFAVVASGFGQYTVNFEDAANETNYNPPNRVLSGIEWSRTECLIGNLANDWRNGNFSARFRGRNGSSFTMVQDKVGGIGTVSFQYRRYGTDATQQPWVVEYSINSGANWLPIGSSFTATATVQTFSETINVSGNIRIRIRINSTPGTTGDRRMNLDDIVLTDYAGSTTYNLTYNGNGSDGGTAPTDATAYDSGDTVTVLSTGNLTRDGYYFTGWNTVANGSGTSYLPGTTFSITADTTLYAQWTEIPYDYCLDADFDGDFGNLPGGFVSAGVANTDPDFYLSPNYSRSLTSTQTLRMPPMARPAAIAFYAIGSGAGGQLLTLEYTNNGTNWFPLTTYNVSAAGATFYYDSSASTSAEPIAAYRITSGADTIYIDDLTVYCTCDLTASGIADIACNNNGTNATTADDFITFELNPTVISSSTVYNVSVSSGTITPNMNINYGSPTTFTLQGGSAGGGNVIVTITDGISGGCELDVVITDPGSCSVSTVDWCNVQFPNTTQTITEGDNLDVYAQVYEPGVTEAAGAGVGITAWIGYNTVNDNPNTAGWTWVPANFNVQVGNNDEFDAEIGSGLNPGTYYYASRFQLNGSTFVYGGTGGIWNNDSVQLNVIADQLDFCNVDFPKTGTIDQGDNFTVYAQAYEPGVTEAAGQGANIEAWIGYTTVGINHEPWQAAGWTWVLATYDSDFGNNDNYRAQIGSTLPVGTYYYASRFRLNGSSTYSYGGIQNDNVGNFWNTGTFNNGVLVVEVASCADLFISEYVEGSSDNKYIEIYNPTNAVINLGTYRLHLYTNGSATPSSNVLLSGTIAPYSTIVYRNNLSGIYSGATTVNAVCNFNGDDAIALLNNGNFIDIIGTIGQDPGTQWTAAGGYTTLNSTLVRRATVQSGVTVNPASGFPTLDTEWDVYPIDTTTYLGSHTSDCQGPTPELQLVDADGDDQNCGYTIDYGSQALTTTTDITFDIENTGTANLDITTLALSGTNAGDYTIVSPVGAFSIAPAGSQEVVVRFTPSANGTRTATLTITNNDANESACTVLLTGVGFTPVPEINVEGNVGAFPDIVGDGTNIPNGTNNTLYAAQFIGSSQTKSFWVNNEGTSNLTITNISLGGANPGDFTIDVLPNFTIAPGSIRTQLLEITFSPLAAGERNATVTIESNDGDEANFVFNIRGNGNCVSAATSIAPASGPEGTVVTITGSDFGGTTTATVSGIGATVTVISATQIEVTIPAGATSGNIVVLNNLGCASTNGFTVIDNAIASCEGSGAAPNDLFISEVTDATTGGVSYIEIYNGTGNPVNLGDYGLAIHGNATSTPSYTLNLNPVVLNNNDVYVVAIGVVGTQNSTNSCSIIGGNGQLADQTTTLAGINKKDNEHDMIRLVRAGGSVIVDAFGVYESLTWMDATIVTGDRGFNFRRLNTASPLPNPVFNLADWNVIDWVGSGQSSCSTNDYSDIGVYDFSVGTPPIASLVNVTPSECDLTATLSVTGTEGFNGGGDTQELAYQWYYSAPGDLGWTAIVNNAIYSGATTNTLEILNALTLNGYQYYCQVREDDATCYTASNAVKLTLDLKIWNGSISNDWTENANWTPAGLPTVNDVVVIPSGGNPIIIGTPPFPPTVPLYAKSLIVLSGADLEIPVGKNLIVENCIVNNGTIDLKNAANLVQVNETNENSGNGNFFMERIVSDVESLNYIYWSSPIGGFNMSGIPGSNTHRYYWSPTAVNANGTQGDWIQTTGVMDEGVGYIIRVAGATPNLNVTLGGNGLGTPQNGTFTTPISRGNHTYADPADDINNNWNLIGNPYPSAISADTFIAENAAQLMNDDPNPAVIGTIYLWRHQATPDAAIDNPFYEDFAINYDGNNYVSYNATGENPAGEFDGNIASGQAFFVVMDDATALNSVTFTNAMRYGDIVTDAYNNGEFLRTSSERESQSTNTIERHRLWLDLIAPNNTSVSTLVGYVTGATNDKDRLFDGYETSATGLGFYSMVGYDRMGIQGRALPFVDTDIVPLGVNLLQTGTHTIAINQLDGLFEAGQTIYLEDLYTNTIHNLRATPYTFHSTSGMFNDRFVLRYTNTTLSIPDVTVDAGLTIVELSNDNVKFTVGHNLTIASVEIYDMLGRQLYDLPGTNAVEVYNLANLSQAAYVAKVTLSNGQTVTKRAVKRH